MRTKLLLAAGTGSIVVLALSLYRNEYIEVSRRLPDVALPSKAENGSVIADSPSKNAGVRGSTEESIPAPPHGPDYYSDLPELAEVIKGYESLSDSEISKNIADVEELLKLEDLIDRANEKKLDDQGFRRLAQLLQQSDALYQIKISRQLDAVEEGFAQTR